MSVAGNLLGHDLRLLSGLGSVVDHRVGVFNANTVGTSLRPEQPHECVVMLRVFPITLPFEQGSDGGQSYSACLNHARECRFMRRWRGGPTAIPNNIKCAPFSDAK